VNRNEPPLHAARELQAINHELSSLLHVEPAALSLGADAALLDELVICGILGGKDVGKSTLINALARTAVSVDGEEVGRGTAIPMVYVHEAMEKVARSRLGAIGRGIEAAVTIHRAEAVRNAVLVDLPDFDSEFSEHLQIVRSVAPLLDRVLWVQTPRKIGDRAWVAMCGEVIKDGGNVLVVLNKADELLADGAPWEPSGDGRFADAAASAERFWHAQHEWVARSLEAAGYPQPDQRRFLVSAAYPEPEAFVTRIGERWDDPGWSRYGNDRRAVEEVATLAGQEMERLRASVLRAVPEKQTRIIKASNREHEHRVNVARMEEHFDLERALERLAQACDPNYLQEVLDEAMGPDYGAAVTEGLRTHLRPDTALADELLERRVERWPLLRLVHWPFGWLSRALGRRIGPADRSAPGLVAEPFFVQGRSLGERIESTRSRILGDHAVIGGQFRLEGEVPPASALAQRASAAARRLPSKLEQAILEQVCEHDRRPSVLGRAVLWFLLLWFPFLQPIAEGCLQMYVDSGAWDLARGAYRIVSAFSAPHLLAGFAVVAVIFVAMVAGMYARGLRAIRQARRGEREAPVLFEALDELLVAEVVVPLTAPFHDRLERLTALRSRLGTVNLPAIAGATPDERSTAA